MITKAGRKLSGELSNAIHGYAMPGDCSELNRLAKRYHRLQETACNESMNEIQQTMHNASERAIEKKIVTIVASMPSVLKGVHFGGDPRGYCVKLIRVDGRGNTWGGDEEGWGIGD